MVSGRGRGDFVNLQCLSPIDQQVRAVGQNYRDFRDLFSCTFLTKDFPEKRYFVSNCPVLSITDLKLSRQSPVGNFSFKVRLGNFRARHHPFLLKPGEWQVPVVADRLLLREFCESPHPLNGVARSHLQSLAVNTVSYFF